MEDDELERDYLEFKKLLDAGDIEGVAQIVADYIFILITNPGKKHIPIEVNIAIVLRPSKNAPMNEIVFKYLIKWFTDLANENRMGDFRWRLNRYVFSVL
jgi:hypothetical protein